MQHLLHPQSANSTADKLSDSLHNKTPHCGSPLHGSLLMAVVLAFSCLHRIIELPVPQLTGQGFSPSSQRADVLKKASVLPRPGIVKDLT